MPKVLISDALSETAVNIFKERGVDVDYQPGLGKEPEKLLAIIGDYDGLAVRSATKARKDLFERAHNLKVVGRAGIGVDNIDIDAATAAGVAVMKLKSPSDAQLAIAQFRAKHLRSVFWDGVTD
ncbi:MAG: hypothetical protein AAFQ96_05495, partial [Pseudomonadota bacterium]